MANNTRSEKLLNDGNYYFFKEAVLSAMTKILPHIIKLITPSILKRSKAIIEQSASRLFNSYESKSNKNL